MIFKIIYNFILYLKFIFLSYKQFNNFNIGNKKFFKKVLLQYNIKCENIDFKFNILIKIIFKIFKNKIHLLFFFSKKKSFIINHSKNNNLIDSTQYNRNALYSWDIIFNKFNLYEKKLQILEIGCFEGCSSVFFLKNFRHSHLTCVDLWKNNMQQQGFKMSTVEKVFDLNIKKYKKNVSKFKISSDKFFKKNLNKPRYFDIIYIDGDHFYQQVFKDLINSFVRLNKNGLIIIDDFNYNFFKNVNENPIGAIVPFISIFNKNIKILTITGQIILQKI